MSTLRQMAYWLAVVEEGSFTRAAARMHVAQPSLSQQIRALENELGGELIERLPRSIRLTSAGKAFLPYARTSVRSAENGIRSARAALDLQIGELEISTLRSIAAGPLPDLIRRWRIAHGGTLVRLHEMSHRRLAEESVREGLSDLGIGPPPLEWIGPVTRLGWEEFVVVLPSDDPYARRTSIPLGALADRLWVMFDRDHGLYDMTIAACASAAAPFKPEHAVLTSQVETASRLAAVGVGPALVPSSSIPRGLDASLLSVEPPLGRELTVYARSHWSPLARAFVDLLSETEWPTPPTGALVIG